MTQRGSYLTLANACTAGDQNVLTFVYEAALCQPHDHVLVYRAITKSQTQAVQRVKNIQSLYLS